MHLCSQLSSVLAQYTRYGASSFLSLFHMHTLKLVFPPLHSTYRSARKFCLILILILLLLLVGIRAPN